MLKNRVLSSLLTIQALRFALTGVMITGLHVLIATVSIQLVLLKPYLANGVAFVAATIVSYIVNTAWSFSSPLHGKNLLRFCIVSSIGLFFAMAISGAAQFYSLHYWYGIGFVACVIPGITFLLHSHWTYK